MVSVRPNPRFAWRSEQIIPGALQSIPKLERPPKTASPTPQPFFPKSSNIGQGFIPSCLIISVELKNLLDSSVLQDKPALSVSMLFTMSSLRAKRQQ